MAKIEINIPDNITSRVIDAICSQYGYTEGGKAAFAKQSIINYIKTIVREHEYRLAEQKARKDAVDAVDAEIILT